MNLGGPGDGGGELGGRGGVRAEEEGVGGGGGGGWLGVEERGGVSVEEQVMTS